MIKHLASLQTLATSISYENGVCTINGVVQQNPDACTEAIKPILGIAAAIFVPILLLIIASLVLWVVALVHNLRHPELPNQQTWTIILILSMLFGVSGIFALVYYFAVMRPTKNSSANMTPPQTVTTNASLPEGPVSTPR